MEYANHFFKTECLETTPWVLLGRFMSKGPLLHKLLNCATCRCHGNSSAIVHSSSCKQTSFPHTRQTGTKTLLLTQLANKNVSIRSHTHSKKRGFRSKRRGLKVKLRKGSVVCDLGSPMTFCVCAEDTGKASRCVQAVHCPRMHWSHDRTVPCPHLVAGAFWSPHGG